MITGYTNFNKQTGVFTAIDFATKSKDVSVMVTSKKREDGVIEILDCKVVGNGDMTEQDKVTLTKSIER